MKNLFIEIDNEILELSQNDVNFLCSIVEHNEKNYTVDDLEDAIREDSALAYNCRDLAVSRKKLD